MHVQAIPMAKEQHRGNHVRVYVISRNGGGPPLKGEEKHTAAVRLVFGLRWKEPLLNNPNDDLGP